MIAHQILVSIVLVEPAVIKPLAPIAMASHAQLMQIVFLALVLEAYVLLVTMLWEVLDNIVIMPCVQQTVTVSQELA